MDANEWKTKGNSALTTGNHLEAVKCYTKAIELDSTQHIFYSNRSAAYLSLGDYEKALEDANKCIELKSDWGKGYARKAAVFHAEKKYDEAIKVYNEGLVHEPNNSSCLNGLEEVKKAAREPDMMSNPLAHLFGQDMFQRIASNPKLSAYLADPEFMKKLQELQQDPSKLNLYLSDQRVMAVLSEFIGMGIKNPSMASNSPPPAPTSSAMPNTNRGREFHSPKKHSATSPSHSSSASKVSEIDEPVEEFLTEEEKNKKEAENLKIEGNNCYKNRELAKALDFYTKAHELDPTNMSYVTNQAAVHFEREEYDECIKACTEAIKIGRETRADYALIAKAYARIGNAFVKKSKETDVELLQQACKSYEDALVENRTKDIEQKLKATETLMRKAHELAYIDPAKGLDAKNEGNEKFKAGDFPGAVTCYTEAIKRDPTNAVYYANRAAALTKLTTFNDAKADCEKAIALDPNYVKAYSRKGAIEFFMKEYHKSMESYKKGLALDESNEECKEGLQRVMYAIQTSDSEEVNRERAQHALADPEIQGILRDPIMQNILQEMSTNPSAAMKYLSDPAIAGKLEKLIASGVLQTK